MNLSPEWAESLRESGLDATHWSRLGAVNAPDHEIFAHARAEGLVILTQDLDFSQILFETAASGPSTILLRLGDELNFKTRRRVAGIILHCRSEIESGALLVIDEKKPVYGRFRCGRFEQVTRRQFFADLAKNITAVSVSPAKGEAPLAPKA